MKLAVGLSFMAFITLKYVSSVPTLLRIFIINGCWILSNAFSVSIDMVFIMWFLLFILLMWYIKCWQERREKGALEHCWWECRVLQPLWKAAWRYLKKLKIELPYDPAIALLGICPKKAKTFIWKNMCTAMFIAALFTIAKICKQPKCPSIDEWIKKL